MTLRKRIWNSVLVLLGILLIVSLVMNYMHYKKAQRAQQYVSLLYNQFIFDVMMASDYLGATDGKTDYKRAAVDTADAANVLYAIDRYDFMVEHNYSEPASTPPVGETANFLSYVSLAFVNENMQYRTSNGLITITPATGKKIMLKINDIVKSNMKDSNIPPNKINSVFNQIGNLIPNDIRTGNLGILEFFNH